MSKNITEKKVPGCITQRNSEYRVIRIKLTAGNVDSEQLKVIADIANRYGRGYVGTTSRLGIEIPWVPKELLEDAVQELKEAGLTVGSTGPTVRSIVACKGSICRYGLVDTQELCRQLDKAYFGISQPAKFKIGITGCPNNCIKVQLNDLAFMGQCVPGYDKDKCTDCYACISVCKVKAIDKAGEGGIQIDQNKCVNCGSCIRVCPTEALAIEEEGFAVFLGGKFGRQYRIGQRLNRLYSFEEAIELTGRILEYNKLNANTGERFGDMLERTGFEKIEETIKTTKSIT